MRDRATAHKGGEGHDEEATGVGTEKTLVTSGGSLDRQGFRVHPSVARPSESGSRRRCNRRRSKNTREDSGGTL
ncbi:Protein of unknown function [Gryllus bimaculatus]|nr:Protein of unknown function [Gryllus bimaculatus]